MDDLISRQAAIDEIRRFAGYLDEDMINRIHIGLKRLPSAQPQIIRCKECRHSEYDAMFNDRYCHYNGKAEVVGDEHYCGYGKRRPE